MKDSIIITLFILVFLALPVAGYQVAISTPSSVQVGDPVIVTGTTTLPVGVSINVVFSRAETTTTLIEKKTMTVQENKSFSISFPTKGLERGQYKVEVPDQGTYSFLGDSVTVRIVQLIDRSNEVTFAAPFDQPYNGKLIISGQIKGNQGDGVELTVEGSSGILFGPEFVETDNLGNFLKQIAITTPGEYLITLNDNKGKIGIFTYKSTGTTPIETTEIQTETQAIKNVTVSANGKASIDQPAYFKITPGNTDSTVITSSGIDWVLEVSKNNGGIEKINLAGDMNPEEIPIKSSDSAVYVKVYPYSFKDSGIITISGNVKSIDLLSTPPSAFSTQTQTSIPTTQSPFSPLVCVIGLICSTFTLFYRERERKGK